LTTAPGRSESGRLGEDPVVVLCAVGPLAEPLRARFPDVVVVDISGGLPAGVEGEVLFGGMGQPSVDAMGRGIRWVQWIGTGIDTLPPEIRAAELLTTARGSSAVAISEYVIAAMASFSRNFPDSWVHEPPEQWNYQPAVTLAGATVALFGFGGIAQRVARIALALDMSVVAQRWTDAPSPISGVKMAGSFAELVAEADHLVLAAPATDETRHVINAASLAHVKPGLHLVNIARGSLVDQDALRIALDDGTVARASVDVTDPEPLPAGHWLYQHPKVFLTPHSSWSGRPPFSGSFEIFCDNLARYLAGQPLQHLVHDGY